MTALTLQLGLMLGGLSGGNGGDMAYTFAGARVSLGSNESTSTNRATLTAVNWDTEDADTHDIVDLGASASRMTIPASLDGRYAVHICTIDINGTASGTARLYRDGSALFQYTSGSGNSALGRPIFQLCTDVIQLTSGEYYEIFVQGDGACGLVNNSSWGMYLL